MTLPFGGMEIIMENLKIGLQLYSMRDEMEKDVYSTLKKVKEIGYDYVEFAGFFGIEADDMKKMLDEIGLKAISVHQTLEGFLEKSEYLVNYYKTIGLENAVIPGISGDNLIPGSKNYEKTLADIKKMSDILAKEGIVLSYHNHEFEFKKTGDKYILDNLYEALDDDTLKTQLDLCWVKYGGEDPVKYINKYSKRCPTLHFKDFLCEHLNAGAAYALIDNNGKPTNKRKVDGFQYKPLGDGVMDFKSIVEAAKKSVAEYAIVEQDGGFETMSSIDSVAKSRKYLKDNFGL